MKRKYFILMSLALSIAFAFSLFAVPVSVYADEAGATAERAVYYIDPAFTGTVRDGSIENPFLSWSEVTPLQAGKRYLQKSGTTCNIDFCLEVPNDSTIGAYENGSRPVIYNTGKPAAGSNYYAIHVGGKKNVTIRDIVSNAPNATANIVFEGTANSDEGNYLLENCEISGGDWGVRSHHEYTGGVKILNNNIHHTGDDGMYVAGTPNMEIAYNYIHDVNQHYFTVGTSESVAAGDCIQFDYGWYNIWIHHNLLDKSSTGNKFALIMGKSTSTPATNDSNVLIEYNHMIGPNKDDGAVMYLHPGINPTIRYNILENGKYGIFCEKLADNLVIHDNIFNYLTFAIFFRNEFQASLYNNTFYDTGYLEINKVTQAFEIKNNIFHLTGTDGKAINVLDGDASLIASDYNLFYPERTNMLQLPSVKSSTLADWQLRTGKDANSIAADPCFVDADRGDFSLQVDSPAKTAGVEIPGYTTGSSISIGADVALIMSQNISNNGSVQLKPAYGIIGRPAPHPVPPSETPTIPPVSPEDILYSKPDFTSGGVYNLGQGQSAAIVVIEFDFTPVVENAGATIGFTDSSFMPGAWGEIPILVRGTAGKFDARNGGAYTAVQDLYYSKDSTYHCKIIVDFESKKYDFYVTDPATGSIFTIADDYEFRTGSKAIDDIGWMAFINDAKMSDYCKISNFSQKPFNQIDMKR